MKNMDFRQKLRDGKTVFGTWSMTGSTTVVNVIGSTGLDFIIFDMEHSSMSFETVENMVRAAECVGCYPIIRVSDSSESTILRALETGCNGIMVPHVSSGWQATKIVSACKYPPEGKRGLSPYTRNHNFSHHDLAKSMERNNNDIFIGILIEDKRGIECLKDILSVEGIDLIYTGIYDLSQSIGLPGELNHPKVLQIQKECSQIIKEKGLIAGSFAKVPGYIKILIKNNFQFIAYSADSYVLRKAYEATYWTEFAYAKM